MQPNRIDISSVRTCLWGDWVIVKWLLVEATSNVRAAEESNNEFMQEALREMKVRYGTERDRSPLTLIIS